MATPEEKVGGPATDDDQVIVDGEMLGPESGDPGYSSFDPDLTTSKEAKEKQVEEDKKETEEKDSGKEEGKKESGKGLQHLKSTLLISGAVVALIGAIFAITKNIKHA